MVDRDVVLEDGGEIRDARVVAAYDALAGAYAEQLLAELDRKPFDRWLLERLATSAPGPIADVGCGPGHIAFHLAQAGAEVTGFDLSPAMVREAAHRFPQLAVEVADLRHLPLPAGEGGWGAIVAWYSFVHLAGSELTPVIQQLAEVLRPGGWLAVAVHVGDEVVHQTELWDTAIDVHWVFHDPEEVVAAFAAAGLVDVEWYRRGPHPEAEAATERLYVLGRRPPAAA